VNPLRWRALALLVAMCITALATLSAEPTVRLADRNAKFTLDTMIPRQFGGWAMDERQSAAIVNPEAGGLVSRIYNQVLSRTYIHGATRRSVMLSIAYGEDQSRSHDLHVPDVCYPSGGFQIKESVRSEMVLRQGSIPVKHLVAQRIQRREPLTYWALIGDHVATSAVGAKLTALSYGLRGQVPDGIIFRVSTVGLPDAVAFDTQREFVQDLFDSLSSASRKRLSGLL
jgi:EpsI family protein